MRFIAAERCAALTETHEYPRSESGRFTTVLEASLSDAFHAASSSPSASQLSDASRCSDQNFRGALNVALVIDLVMVNSS
jgi:hypothetical protein